MTFGNRTKGDLLKHALSYALIKVRVARHRLGLSEAMRNEAAEDTVKRLRATGQWQELDDEVENGTKPFPSLASPMPGRGES